MTKKKLILFALSFLIFIVILYLGFRIYRSFKEPEKEISELIPNDAIAILFVEEPFIEWKNFSTENNFFRFLRANNNFSKLINNIDSIFYNFFAISNQISNINEIKPTFSLHKRNNNFYILTSIKSYGNEEKFLEIAKKLSTSYEIIKDNNHQIHIVKKNNKEYYLTEVGNYFIFSENKSLLNDFIINYKKDTETTKNNLTDLKNIFKTKNNLNLFVNYQKINEFFNFLFSISLDATQPISNNLWLAFEISGIDNFLNFNGITKTTRNDSTGIFSLLSKNKENQVQITQIISSEISSFFYINYDTLQTFFKILKNLYNKSEDLKQQTSFIKEKILNNIYDEFAIASIDILKEKNNIARHYFTIFKCKNACKIRDTIEHFLNHNKIKDTKISEELYITTLEDSTIPIFLTKNAIGIYGKYLTVIKEYIIFTNNLEAIQKIIKDYIDDKTLSKDINFISLFEKTQENPSFIYYINNQNLQNPLTKDIKSNYNSITDKIINNISQYFESLLLNAKNNENISSINLILKQKNLSILPNTINKKEFLWNYVIEQKLQLPPILLENPFTKECEIFLADIDNNIYLISNSGQLLWKYHIDSPIISNIYQVDYYKNNKYQILFNTAEKIYLIDRKGRNVEGYPIKLKRKATNGIAVFDYNKTKDYRIIFATEDNKLNNLNIKGQTPIGWEPFSFKNPVKKTICLLQEGKDILVVAEENNTIHLLDKRGKLIKSINTPYPFSANPIQIYKINNIQNICFTDTSGKIYFIKPDGILTYINLINLSSQHKFIIDDVDNNGKIEYILADYQKLYVYNQDKIPIIQINFSGNILYTPNIFTLNDKSKRIGIVSNNEIFLISADGSISEGFPKHGILPFIIKDINKDKLLEIIFIKSGNILVVERLFKI